MTKNKESNSMNSGNPFKGQFQGLRSTGEPADYRGTDQLVNPPAKTSKATLEDIQALCAVSLHLEVNDHLGVYRTFDEALQDLRAHLEEMGAEESEFDFEEMIANETIVDLQVYPNTPIGSIRVCTGSIQTAIDKMYAILIKDAEEEHNAWRSE